MNGTNLFKIALRALANNKLRAFLTMLGIIIGVASVIAMLAIGQGSKKSIQQQISEMGSNMIMIHPGAEMRGGVRQDPSAMQTLKLENYEKLSEECTNLSGISPNVSSSGQLVAGANNYPSSVSGVSMDYLMLSSCLRTTLPGSRASVELFLATVMTSAVCSSSAGAHSGDETTS